MDTRHTAAPIERLLRLVLVVALLLGVVASLAPASLAADEATPAAETLAETTPESDPGTTGTTDPSIPSSADPNTPEPAPEPSATETATPTPEATETPPAPTAEPTATITAEPATVEPTADPSATATAQPAEPTVERKPTKEQAVVAAATVLITILPKDPNGGALAGVCFDVHRDAGNQTIGGRVTTICDWNYEGKLTVELSAGAYALVDTQHPNTVGKPNPKFFSASSARTITVAYQWLTTLVITAKDAATGQIVKDGCYIVSLPGSSFGTDACDATDGVSDGKTTIGGIDRGFLEIRTWFYPPPGYLPMTSQQLEVKTIATPRTATVTHIKGGTLEITKMDEANQLLPGACFDLFKDAGGGVLGEGVANRCDHYDGEDDGTISFTGVAAGNYVIREYSAPAGYLTAANKQVTIVNGQTTSVTVIDRLGGSVIIQARDDLGNVINDICVLVFEDAGGGARGPQVFLPPCQTGASSTDGESRMVGLPGGNYVLAQYSPQPGYVHAPEQRLTIAAGETKTVQMVSALGGTVTVNRVDGEANELPGECVRVVKDAGGGTRGATVIDSVCDAFDGTTDGATRFGGLEAGDYLLVDLLWSLPNSPSADIPFSIEVREQLELSVTNVEHGTLRILRKNPEGATLLGGCFSVFWAPGTPRAGDQVIWDACDGLRETADGKLDLRLPNGTFEVRETAAPVGFAKQPAFTVVISNSGLTEKSITSDRLPKLTVKTVDSWGDVVKGVCVGIAPDTAAGNTGFEQNDCDGYGGDTDGLITFSHPLHAGAWIIRSDPNNVYPFPTTNIVLAVNEVRTLEIVVTKPAPVILLGPFVMDLTDTTMTIYFTTDQKTVSEVEFGVGGAYDRVAPSAPETPTTTHRIQVTGLTPGTWYQWRLVTSNPYGSDSHEGWEIRTSPSGGAITVKKVTSTGSTLKGACFELYEDAGNGALGEYLAFECDAFEADGDNGRTTFGGLPPGSYVVSEMSAPAGYKLAKSVAVSISTNQKRTITVTDTRGGTVLTLFNLGYGTGLLRGACFEVYTRGPGETLGAYVTWSCDELDGEDALTRISGLGTGEYVLVQSYVPDGYVRAEWRYFSVDRGLNGVLELTVYNHPTNGESVIAVRSVDANGNLMTGACYGLYRSAGGTTLGDWMENRCDGTDGRDDGITHFVVDISGRFIVLEYIAPKGFLAGKKTAFTKEWGRVRTVKVTQSSGGVTVKVTTLAGNTSGKIPGACYGIYRSASGGRWEFVTVACDGWDGANDGVTRILGVPPGTYRVYQTQTPAGFREPAFATVTIGTTGKSVNVRTYPR